MTNYSILREDDEAVVTLIVSGDPNSPFMARDDHPNFKAIVAALIEDVDVSEITPLFDVADTIAVKFQRLSERVTVNDGEIKFDGVAIDSTLATQIMDVLSEGGTDASWKGLVAFMENVYTNPDPATSTRIFDWLKAQDGMTITEDGLIVGYKKVSADAEHGYRSTRSGKEPCTVRFADGTEKVFTGYIPNPVGATVEMPRNLVNDNADQTCSVGLHVGAWGYMGCFGGSNVLEVHVNPRDVRSVPSDYNGQKVRVCRYKIVGPVTQKYNQAFKASAEDKPRERATTATPTTREDLDLTLAPLRTAHVSSNGFKVGDTLTGGYIHRTRTATIAQHLGGDFFVLRFLDGSSGRFNVATDLGRGVRKVTPQSGRISCGAPNRTHGVGGATSQVAKGNGRHPAQDEKGRFIAGRPASQRDPKTGRFA